MLKNKQKLLKIVALAVVFSILFSYAFILLEGNHDHAHSGECEICNMIGFICQIFKLIIISLVMCISLSLILSFLATKKLSFEDILRKETLILRKTKFSN